MKGPPTKLLPRLSLILLLAALPIGLILFGYIWHSHNHVLEDKRHDASSLVEALATRQSDFIARTDRFLQALAAMPELQQPDNSTCGQFLAQIATLHDAYLNLAVARPDGDLVCSALPLAGRVNVADRDFMQRALASRRFAVGTYQVDRVSKQTAFGFAYPIIDQQRGRAAGVVIAMVSLDAWSRRLGNAILPADAVAVLIDANHTIIAHYPPNSRIIGLFSETYGYHSREVITAGEGITVQLRDTYDKPQIHAYQPIDTRIDEAPLIVGVSLPMTKAISLANEYLWNGLLLIGVGLLALLGVVFFSLRRRVVQPLTQLLGYTKTLGRGEVAAVPDVGGIGEVNALQSEIFTMVQTRLAAESGLRASEARFRQIAETMQEVFWVVTPDWDQVLYVNPAYEYVWQRSVESLYNTPRSWLTSVVREDRQKVIDYITEMEWDNRSHMALPLYRIERRDGTIRWISAKGFPAYDAEGNLTSVIGTAEDVTERKQYELELSERESKYRLLVENTEDLVVKVDTDGHLLFISPSYCKTFGKSEFQLLGKAFMPLVHEEDQASTQEALKKLYYPPHSVYYEHRAMTEKGWRWFGWSETAILDDRQQVVEIVGVGRDITQQKQVEFALRESETRYRELIENMSDGVTVYERIGETDDFVITNFNHAAERMAGYTREQVIGQRVDEIFPGVDELGLLPTIRQVAKDGKPIHRPVGFYRDQRIEVWVEYYVFKLPSGEVAAVFRDATTEKRAIDALKRSEERFRGFFEDLSVGLVIADRDGIALEANKAFAQMFDIEREQVIGRSLNTLLVSDPDSDTAERLKELIDGGLERYRFQTTCKLTEQRKLTANIAIGVLHDANNERTFLYGIAEDVTALETAQAERNKLQRELMRTYRLEALGRLAGGIAHDFNNILGAVSGFVELAVSRMESAEPQKVLGYLEKSLQNSERAKQLIKQLLIFSRGPEYQATQAHDFGKVVSSSMEMIRSLLPSSIAFDLQIIDRLYLVTCDPVQIEQVLLNLCINARDAMDGKGSIQVIVDSYTAQGDRCVICSKPVEGEWVSLRIQDSGLGMAEADIERIFEPFFSTKGRDKGTGLGLSVVHGIVSGYDGHILIDTTKGSGTCFRLLFPIYSSEKAADDKDILELPPVDDLPQPVGMKVLVVDDEAPIRQLIHDDLVNLGYEVFLCKDGQEALHKLTDEKLPVDLMITDQTMPRMTGLELVEELRESGFHLPVILCSGYSESINKEALQRLNIECCLDKPVRLDTLNRLLKQLLSQQHAIH
jgi:two-component system, cell cycle sensor histidine kinase and response regulator CckA